MAVTTTPQQPHAQPPDAGPGAISAALAQISSRLRLARWVRHASRGALIGTAPALIALVLAHWDRLPDRLPLEAAVSVPLLLGLLAGDRDGVSASDFGDGRRPAGGSAARLERAAVVGAGIRKIAWGDRPGRRRPCAACSLPMRRPTPKACVRATRFRSRCRGS